MSTRLGRVTIALSAASAFLGPATLVAPCAAAGVSPAAPRTLYVTSADSGTVTAFRVGPDGGVTSIQDPLPAGAETRPVVLTPDGRFAFVGSPGTDDGDSQIFSFRVQESGALAGPGEPFDAGRSIFGMAMAPNGRTLYATDQDETNPQVRAFAVRPGGGLTPIGSQHSGGANPRGVAVAPDGRHVYLVNGTRTSEPDTLVSFAVRADGSLDKGIQRAVLGEFAAQIAITSDGRFLYAVNQESTQSDPSNVWAFRTAYDGGLSPVPNSPFPAPNAPEGINIAPDGRHLYTQSVLDDFNPNGANAVGAYDIRADGGLQPVEGSPFPGRASTSPLAGTITPDGRFLYASNESSNVSAYALNPSGALSEIPESPFTGKLEGPAFQSIAVSPDQGPVARFSAEPYGTYRSVRFDARASSDPDGRVVRYDWDFGDETILPDGGPRPTHAYPRPGTFTVTLTVTDNEGCSDHYISSGQSPLCNGTRAAQFKLTVLAR